jgi:hypothetical protein
MHNRRGKLKAAAREAARQLYFKLHGLGPFDEEPYSRCQVCGAYLTLDEADPAHKRRASTSGGLKKFMVGSLTTYLKIQEGFAGERPENIVCAHRVCHIWADATAERRRFMEIHTEINVKDGGVFCWPKAEAADLAKFKKVNGWLKR